MACVLNDVLIINGPCGVGKTTAACAVSDFLCAGDIPNQHIDFDSLTQLFPRPDGDPHGQIVGLKALAAAMNVYDDDLMRPLILPMVIETPAELDAVATQLNRRVIHCRLTAPATVRHARLAKRETGEWLDRLSKRSDELTGVFERANLPEHVIDTTDLTPSAVASKLLDVTGWLDQKDA